jgi:hypothetical protein
MAFELDKKTLSAVDLATGISLRMSTKFYDIADAFFYIYKSPDIEFEFSVAEKRERRTILIKGTPSERKQAVAGLILEPTLKAGFARASHSNAVSSKAYEQLKRDVSEGMFVLLTWGGDLLRFVPDYKIAFIQDLSDVQ